MIAEHAKLHRCPRCKGPLIEVVQSPKSALNEYQWAASIAGRWYCEACPSNDRGREPLCYWWTHELEDAPNFQI